MTLVNSIRACSFLARVFQNQQQDPFCGNCKAWVNSVNAVREKIERIEHEPSPDRAVLSLELEQLFRDARGILAELVLPPDAPGQKRAGKCLMPPGVCFVKSSLAILEKT